MKKFFIVKFIFCFVFGISSQNILACSCASIGDMCGVFESFSNVFIAEAEEKTYKSESQILKVIENLKGTAPEQIKAEKVIPCFISFETGKKYLVYAQKDKETKMLSILSCGNTKPLDRAETELGYIRRIIAGEKISLIYGKIQQSTGKKEPQFYFLPNIPIELETEYLSKGRELVKPKKSERIKQVISDNEGNFLIENIPEGHYKARISLPEGLTTIWKEEIDLRIKGSTCRPVNFGVQIDGRISGKITFNDGKPIQRKYVTLYRNEYSPYLRRLSTRTDLEGNYEVKGIPPGEYKLTVSPQIPRPGVYFPFSSYYYPGTFDDSALKLIKLGYAEKVSNINLQIPPEPFAKKIKIEVYWEEGIIVSPPNVYFKAFAETAETSPQYVYPNKEGIPTLTIYSGFEYQVFASGSLKDGRLYETDKMIINAETSKDTIKLKARLRR